MVWYLSAEVRVSIICLVIYLMFIFRFFVQITGAEPFLERGAMHICLCRAGRRVSSSCTASVLSEYTYVPTLRYNLTFICKYSRPYNRNINYFYHLASTKSHIPRLKRYMKRNCFSFQSDIP